jgi:isopenicillin-N epimerase
VREHFLLDPEVVYLNHGVYGACPRPVFERYQAWQLELEREPAQFISLRLPELLAGARAELAAYLRARPDDVTFVQNATTGVNMAARALDLQPGDEVLTTDLEYGACDYTWAHVCDQAGARYVRAEIPLPLDGGFVDQLFARRTERTRAVYLSHITSATALLLPVEETVARAGAEGLVTIVDGAHAPGHVDLDLDLLGADFYAGNCHKWMCAPKGAGFLHVAPEWQDRVSGPIVSWGHGDPSTFISRTERQGTRDPAAYLTVPDAIAFVREHDNRERCVALAREARAALCELLGTEPLSPEASIRQLAAVRLPAADPELSQRLFDDHRIEIPTMGPRDDLLRISIATYTEQEDVDHLLDVLPSAISPRAAARPRAR